MKKIMIIAMILVAFNVFGQLAPNAKTPDGSQFVHGLTMNNMFLAVATNDASVAYDASVYNIIDIQLTNSVTMVAPTNAADGARVLWRIYAIGNTHTISVQGTSFKIPSSSSLTNFVIASNTTSVLLTQYYAARTNWFLMSYIGGY